MANNELEKIEELLLTEAEKIKPSRECFQSFINNLPEKNAAIKPAALPEVFEDINSYFNRIWKIVMPVTAVIVVAIVVGFWRLNKNIEIQQSALNDKKIEANCEAPVEEIKPSNLTIPTDQQPAINDTKELELKAKLPPNQTAESLIK